MMSGHIRTIEAHKPDSLPLLRMFSRRWMLATVLVLAAAGVMVRLGIWQLDRLAQRRAFNARAQAQMAQPVLDLAGPALGADLSSMEYRAVTVRGTYDFDHQVALRNQVKDNVPGVSLITPLKIQGSDTYILVERGWVPGIDADPITWRSYDEPGVIEISGIIRRSRSTPDFGQRADPIPAPGEEPLRMWYFANVEAIGKQLPYQVLAVYLQQAPDSGRERLPSPSLPALDLTEGPHQSYAIQWFSFATVLLLGYPFFIRKRDSVR